MVSNLFSSISSFPRGQYNVHIPAKNKNTSIFYFFILDYADESIKPGFIPIVY